jgi:hypothetical protein
MIIGMWSLKIEERHYLPIMTNTEDTKLGSTLSTSLLEKLDKIEGIFQEVCLSSE